MEPMYLFHKPNIVWCKEKRNRYHKTVTTPEMSAKNEQSRQQDQKKPKP